MFDNFVEIEVDNNTYFFNINDIKIIRKTCDNYINRRYNICVDGQWINNITEKGMKEIINFQKAITREKQINSIFED